MTEQEITTLATLLEQHRPPSEQALTDLLGYFAALSNTRDALLILLDEEGAIHQSAHLGRPLDANACLAALPPSASTSGRTLHALTLPGDLSGWALPLISTEGELLAALFLATTSTPPRARLEASAALLVPWIENYRLRRQLAHAQAQQQHQRELAQALAEAAAALTDARNHDEVLDEILEQLQRVVPHTASNIAIIEDEHTRTVRWRGYAPFGLETHITELRLPLSTPSIQQMIATQQPIVISDTHADPIWVVLPALEWLRSYAAAPIVIEEQIIGFINVDSEIPGFFTAEHGQHLQTFADYASAALQNAYFFEETRRRQEHLEGLNRITTAVNRLLDLDAILEVGLAQALQIANMTRGGIYLWDAQTERLQLQVHQGLTPEVIERVRYHRAGEGITGRAFQERRTLLVEDIGAHYPEMPVELQTLIKAQISLPLIVEDQAVGVMSLNRPQDRPLQPGARQLLQAIADQLALAVQRGRLASQLQMQVEMLHSLYVVSAALLGQTDSRSALFILLRTLHDLSPDILSTAYYRHDEIGWQRVQLYASQGAPTPLPWAEGAPWADEADYLDACETQRELLTLSDPPAPQPSFWPALASAGVRQLHYIPLAVPPHDFFGVVAVLHTEATPLTQPQRTLIWALIQQGTAAMSRVRLYERSRETESRLAAILESSQDGMLLVTPSLHIRYINGQLLKLLDLSDSPPQHWEAQALPQLLLAIRHTAPALIHWLLRAARQLSHLPYASLPDERNTFQTSAGRTLTLHHWPVYGAQQLQLGSLFILRDVTERVALEKMRDDLLHMIVHDMRNPLAVIHNTFQMLEYPAMQQHLDTATELGLSNAERLLTLINAILDTGRLEAGQLHPTPGLVRLEEIIRSVKSSTILGAQARILEIDLRKTLPPLWVDPLLIERVFQNLLDNARKFIPLTGGRIRISAQREGKWLRIAFYNNGPPIPPAVEARLFEKFASGEPHGQGYGLGLAFCRLAVEAHGGKIWAENHPKGGVTFYFTLPIAQGHPRK